MSITHPVSRATAAASLGGSRSRRRPRTDNPITAATTTYARWIAGKVATRMWPGSALAAGEATPARPSGNRTTLSTNADGLCSATGSTTGTTSASTATR